MDDYSRYIIRHAAGRYWLIDIKQSPIPYKKPVVINSIGAFIWEKHRAGLKSDEIAALISSECGISHMEALNDIKEFMKQLEEQGIEL